MSSNRTKGVINLTIATMIFLLSGYVTNLILARILDVSSYGSYAVIISIITLINIMQLSGVPQAVSRFIAQDNSKSEEILLSGLKIQLVFTMLITILFGLLSYPLSFILHETNNKNLLLLATLVFPIYGLFSLYSGYYNGLHKFTKQSLIYIAYSISKLLIITIGTLKYGLFGAILGFVCAPLIALFFSFRMPRTSTNFPLKPIVSYSIPLVTFSIVITLMLSIDLLMLKSISASSRYAGYYTVAQNIALIPYMLIGAVGQILYPSIAKDLKRSGKKLASITLNKTLRYSLIAVMPLVIFLFFNAPEIVSFLFGRKYLPAVTSLKVLLVAYLMLAFFSLIANALNGSGRAKASTLAILTGVVVSFIASLILIPTYESFGASISILFGSICSLIMITYMTNSSFELTVPIGAMIRTLLASIVSIYVLSLIGLDGVILPIYFVIFASLYFLLLIVSGEFSKLEINKLKTSILKLTA